MSNQLKIVWGSCLPSLVDEVEIFCGNPSVSLHCSSKLSARLLPQQVFSPTKNTARPTRHRNESGCSSLTRCLSAPIFARSLLIAYLSLPKYSCQCSWNFQDQGNWQEAERSTRSTETSWKSGITRLLTSNTFRCISWISFHLPCGGPLSQCCKVQCLGSLGCYLYVSICWFNVWMFTTSRYGGEVPYWYLIPACIPNHMLLMILRNLGTHDKTMFKCPNLFQFLQGIRSLAKSAEMTPDTCAKNGKVGISAHGIQARHSLSLSLSQHIETCPNTPHINIIK